MKETMDAIAAVFEWLGVATIIAAALVTVVVAVRDAAVLRLPAPRSYAAVRTTFGRGLLLGLEILVAADLIRTVAVDASLESVGVLGLLVVVRTLLSISLDVDIDGVAPWRRREAEEREAAAREAHRAAPS